MTARYRLAPLRAQRELGERVRRGDLAAAVGRAARGAAEADEVAARVARARAALDDAIAARDGLLGAGTAAWAIAQHERYQHRLRRELVAVRGEHHRAEARHRGQLAEVDTAREHLVLARADREVIERHFAAWRTERRKLAERRED